MLTNTFQDWSSYWPIQSQYDQEVMDLFLWLSDIILYFLHSSGYDTLSKLYPKWHWCIFHPLFGIVQNIVKLFWIHLNRRTETLLMQRSDFLQYWFYLINWHKSSFYQSILLFCVILFLLMPDSNNKQTMNWWSWFWFHWTNHLHTSFLWVWTEWHNLLTPWNFGSTWLNRNGYIFITIPLNCNYVFPIYISTPLCPS